jgi:hypothetical protein
VDGRPTAQNKSDLRQKLEAGFAPPRAEPAVDYPRDGERVASREYTLRIATALPGVVEVSIDDGEWLPCRSAAGFWWRDWSGYGEGLHRVLARVTRHKHLRHYSESRKFVVDFAETRKI